MSCSERWLRILRGTRKSMSNTILQCSHYHWQKPRFMLADIVAIITVFIIVNGVRNLFSSELHLCFPAEREFRDG